MPVLSLGYKFLRTVVCLVSNLLVKLFGARTSDSLAQINSSDRQMYIAIRGMAGHGNPAEAEVWLGPMESGASWLL